MKRIIFFENLDFISIFFIIFYKLFNRKVYYRETNLFFKKKKTKLFLKSLNIIWLNYLDLDCKYFNESFKIRRNLEENFIKREVKDSFFLNSFSKLYQLNEKELKKFYLCLRGELGQQGEFIFDSSSLSLLNYFFDKNKFIITYFSRSLISSLLLKENELENIKINNFHCLIFLILKNLRRLIKFVFTVLSNIFKRKISSKKYNKNTFNKTYNFSDYKIAFFPHKGLRYSNAYKNTHIYDSNIDSKLYKEKIFTFFFESTDEVSSRFLKIHNIPNHNLNLIISKKKAIKKTLKFIIKNISFSLVLKNFSLSNFFLLNFYLNFLFTFFKYENFLENFKNLKVIYASYDVLFPKTLIFASELKGIISVSHQERSYHYSYFSPLFYNKYFVSGLFKNVLKKYDYLIDDYIDFGMIRSNKIFSDKQNIIKNDISDLINKKKSKKIVLCIGLMVVDDHDVGIYGEDGVSKKSNIDYVDTILKLSKEYLSCHFVLRFKDKYTISYLSNKIISEINDSPNIEINNNFKNTNIYEMVKISDLIIGKQTSIMEEALSAGKKIIFYDNENHFNSIDYVLNTTDISVRNYNELSKKLKFLLLENGDYSRDDIKLFEDYFSLNKKIDSYKIIKNSILEIL